MTWIRGKIMGWLMDTADSMELSEIVQAVVRRYAKLFADEEVVFLSLPKHNREERCRIICAVLEIEQHLE